MDRVLGMPVVRKVGESTVGEYFLVREPGGGFAVVHRIHPWFCREEEIERLERAAAEAEKLRHPGLVHVLRSGWEDEAFCVVMERVDGGTLGELLERAAGKKLSFAVAAAIIRDAARTSSEVAEQRSGLPHRALSIHSVHVDSRGRTRVDAPPLGFVEGMLGATTT